MVIIRVIIHRRDETNRRGHKGVIEMIFILIEMYFEEGLQNTRRRAGKEMVLYNH